jgi:hypothetical protein
VHQDDSVNLAHALHFTAEDLIANQQGDLSDFQRVQLKRAIARNRSWSRYALVFVALLYIPVFGIVIVTNHEYFISNPDQATGLGIGIGILVLGLTLSGVLTFRGYASMRQFRVYEIAGLAKRETYDYEGFTYRIIRVNKVQFTVEEDIFQAFSNEEYYRIFYVQLFRRYLRILSVEELAFR